MNLNGRIFFMTKPKCKIEDELYLYF